MMYLPNAFTLTLKANHFNSRPNSALLFGAQFSRPNNHNGVDAYAGLSLYMQDTRSCCLHTDPGVSIIYLCDH